MTKIQQLVFPNLDINSPWDMYFRGGDPIEYSLNDDRIFIPKGERISFDTFYNSISPSVWKEHCKFNDINLKILGEGTAKIRFGLHREGLPSLWLAEHEIELEANGTSIEMPFWGDMKDGILFFTLYAMSDVLLKKGYFYTTSSPTQDVKLGVVVTHFNRKQYVIPAINRIDKKILSDSDYSEKISLIVIDNSQNISSEEAKAAIVIPNKNYGGSGGFTRGLLHLKDNDFTHCLFMDDDGSCEIESIRRTYAFFSFSNPNAKSAISGTLLLEKWPSIVHEKGAFFNEKGLISRKKGLNIIPVQGLLEAERKEEINYGAWCFFAFSIRSISHLAFPFFVRGDDILFSLQNKLEIVTMNGISVYIDDFADKESPLTRYLGLRGFMAIQMMMFDLSEKDAIKHFRPDYFSSLYSYDYSSAEAKALSMMSLLKGPDSFELDMDASKVRAIVGGLPPIEKPLPCEGCEYVIKNVNKDKKSVKLFRKITINGLLIPSIFMKKKAIYHTKWYSADLNKIFKYRKVYYHIPSQNAGYFAIHDKMKIIHGIMQYFKVKKMINMQLREAKDKFMAKKDYLTSETFWRNVLELNSK